MELLKHKPQLISLRKIIANQNTPDVIPKKKKKKERTLTVGQRCTLQSSVIAMGGGNFALPVWVFSTWWRYTLQLKGPI